RETAQVLLAPRIARGVVVGPLVDAGLLVPAVAERDHRSRVGLVHDGVDLRPIVRRVPVAVALDTVEPPAGDLVLVAVGVLPEDLDPPLPALGRRGRPLVAVV